MIYDQARAYEETRENVEGLPGATELSDLIKKLFLGVTETGDAHAVLIVPDLESNDEVYKHEDTRLLGKYIEQFLKQSEVINTSLEERRNYFAQLSGDDFINLIKLIGGLLRGKKIGTLIEFDGGYEMAMGGNEVPHEEDKIMVLKKFWKLASNFLNNPSIKNHYEALAYASIVTTKGIVLVHPYADMNGRISRLLSYTIFNGGPTEAVWENILSQSGGRTTSDIWALDELYAQNGDLLKYDKNSFSNPDQPDKILADRNTSQAHGFMVREWSIRAIIDEFASDYLHRCLIKNITHNEKGETILDGNTFLWEIVQGEQGITVEGIKRLLNREKFAGNFLRAMATESPYAYGDEANPDSTVITPEDITRDAFDVTLTIKCAQARAMLKYFIPDVNFSDQASIQEAILQLPLRKQVLVELAKEIKEFRRIYED